MTVFCKISFTEDYLSEKDFLCLITKYRTLFCAQQTHRYFRA